MAPRGWDPFSVLGVCDVRVAQKLLLYSKSIPVQPFRRLSAPENNPDSDPI